MVQYVIDANVLFHACDNCDNALAVLKNVKENKCKVLFCTEIIKEYKAMANKPSCHHKKIVKSWVSDLIRKSNFGKKVQIDKNDINRCFLDLIKRNKFSKGDIIYIKTAEKIKDQEKVIIAYEHHFKNADCCILALGITRLDLNQAVKLIEKSYVT